MRARVSSRSSAGILGLLCISAATSAVGCDRSHEERPQPGSASATPKNALPGMRIAAAALASSGLRDALLEGGAAPVAAPRSQPKDLNVLVISIDSLRADMPWAGYPRPIAPRLTELEKRAVSYTHAYSISSYTSMSLGGFLGGRLPSGMKRSGFFFGKYPQENTLFPEVLHASKVKTLSAHAHGYFKDAGFEQGFDAYEIVPNIVFKNDTDPNVTSPQHEAIAERLLGDPALDTTKFFAWFHFLDPHDMYVGHEKDGIPAYGPTIRDKYDAEVTFTDRYIGKLLDFVATKPWASRTAIIITADHGEAFGEHGMHSHGFELWENLVRVPMFLVVPGVPPKHIDVPRSTLDLAPTILELMGVSPTTPAEGGGTLELEGTSLVGEITGRETPVLRDVILDLPMTSDNDKRRGLIRGTNKIVGYGKEETLKLYDLTVDPAEDKPILKGEAFDEMARRYRERSKNIQEVAPYACGPKCLNRAYAKSAAGSTSK